MAARCKWTTLDSVNLDILRAHLPECRIAVRKLLWGRFDNDVLRHIQGHFNYVERRLDSLRSDCDLEHDDDEPELPF